VLDKRTRLLYVAPESLTKEENIEFLKKVNISFYAIDEAHCISEWGHDFRPEYRRIRPIINKIGTAPLIALTATATPKVQNDIQKNLDMLEANVFKSSFRRHNLYYEIRPKVHASKEIIKFILANHGKSGIIYCLSRKKVEELAETLKVNGIKVLPYHAGMDAMTRSSNQDQFLMEEVDVIVATIAFGMGIDKPDVRFVIHYDMPKSLEGYYQETGRAGRDGGEGLCIAFYRYKDIQKLEKFMQGKPVAEQEIGKQLLLETVAYAESAVCRPKLLLNYFGEFMEEGCDNCDNCLHPKERFEGKTDVLLSLKSILAVQEKYWNAVLRQALIAGFITKDIENYGLLMLTEAGHAFIKKPYSMMLTQDHDFDIAPEEGVATGGGGTGAVDEELMHILKDLRKKLARKLNLPPFVIFQDPSLEDMAIQYPVMIEELQNIVGVGAGKAKKYGAGFVEVIHEYVEEKDIIRPQDMVVKSVVNKSGVKVYIIQNIDRKLSLDDIANAKNLSLMDLIEEVEAIVGSGTKLNIDYYLNEIMDDEKLDEIFEYFREAETESIDDALAELGEEYFSEEEIRLVRIKFFSELAN